jgi:DNA-binding beta-propeller fold protein YncE
MGLMTRYRASQPGVLGWCRVGASLAVWMVLAALATTALAGCGVSHAVARNAGAEVSFQRLSGSPFGVAITPDGRYAFVDLLAGRVQVYSLASGTPRLVRTIAVPGEAVGSSLTRGGRLLLVADGRGADVVSVARTEHGEPHPVLGSLQPPSSAPSGVGGAIETTSSANGRYAFVSLEFGNPRGAIAVYDLGTGPTPQISSDDYVGLIKLGEAVVGSAVSPDGQTLYATSELAAGSPHLTRAGAAGSGNDGSLSVIDVNAAERGSSHAVASSVPADSQPVRIALSPSGSVVWVTARASDSLLAFSAHRLKTDPARALLATVKVGAAPVGLATFDHGSRIIVADSNRFNARGAHAALTIINARAALAHHRAVIASLPSGLFPREIAIDPRHNIALVTNFGSDQLETVRLGRFR